MKSIVAFVVIILSATVVSASDLAVSMPSGVAALAQQQATMVKPHATNFTNTAGVGAPPFSFANERVRDDVRAKLRTWLERPELKQMDGQQLLCYLLTGALAAAGQGAAAGYVGGVCGAIPVMQQFVATPIAEWFVNYNNQQNALQQGIWNAALLFGGMSNVDPFLLLNGLIY